MFLDRLNHSRNRRNPGKRRFTRTALAIEVNGRYLPQCLAQRHSARWTKFFVHAQLSSRTEPDPVCASDDREKTWRAQKGEVAAVEYQTKRWVEQGMVGLAYL